MTEAPGRKKGTGALALNRRDYPQDHSKGGQDKYEEKLAGGSEEVESTPTGLDFLEVAR